MLPPSESGTLIDAARRFKQPRSDREPREPDASSETPSAVEANTQAGDAVTSFATRLALPEQLQSPAAHSTTPEGAHTDEYIDALVADAERASTETEHGAGGDETDEQELSEFFDKQASGAPHVATRQRTVAGTANAQLSTADGGSRPPRRRGRTPAPASSRRRSAGSRQAIVLSTLAMAAVAALLVITLGAGRSAPTHSSRAALQAGALMPPVYGFDKSLPRPLTSAKSATHKTHLKGERSARRQGHSPVTKRHSHRTVPAVASVHTVTVSAPAPPAATVAPSTSAAITTTTTPSPSPPANAPAGPTGRVSLIGAGTSPSG